MRKPTLLALTALTALGASAVATTLSYSGGVALTGATDHTNVKTALAGNRVGTLRIKDASLTATVRGGRDLRVAHYTGHTYRANLSSKTGLPVLPKPPAPPVTHAAIVSTPAPPVVSTPAPVTAPAAPSGGVWYELRMCESGDNYAADTGNGYYGAYQFLLSTWQALGFSGLPSEAAPAVQDEAARELQARSGWGQWPQCAAQLGLY